MTRLLVVLEITNETKILYCNSPRLAVGQILFSPMGKMSRQKCG